MIENYPFADTPISLFLVINVILTMCCSVWCLQIYTQRRSLLLKPSILLLFFTHIFFQWPLVLFSGFIEEFLPSPMTVAILIQAFTLVGLFVSTKTFLPQVELLSARQEIASHSEPRGYLLPCAILFLMLAAILANYFRYVPIEETGLYALFFNPSESDEARDFSFNSLPQYMKYAMSFLLAVISPLLASVLTMQALRWKWHGRYFMSVMSAGLVLIVVAATSVTGARYNMVKVLAASAMTIWIMGGFRIRLFWLLVGLIGVLFPAAMITLVREGKEVTFANAVDYLVHGILIHRVFVGPIQSGLWHVQFSQLQGFFGASGVPKLAGLMDIPSAEVPTIIGRVYLPHPDVESHCDAGYLLSYYGYFGMASLALSVGLMLALDSLLFLYSRVSEVLLIPCFATVALAVLELIQSDFTTVLISHGLLIAPLLCLSLDLFRKIVWPESHNSRAWFAGTEARLTSVASDGMKLVQNSF